MTDHVSLCVTEIHRIISCVIKIQAVWRSYICRSNLSIIAPWKNLNQFNGHIIGSHREILMDFDTSFEAIYSCVITKISYNIKKNLWFWVKFHHDGEVRRYHWKKFEDIIKKCVDHKKKLRIENTIVTGKLAIRRLILH